MSIRIFFLVLIINLSSAFSWGKTHHIIFIHGTAGDAESFGHMPELLPQVLKTDHTEFVSHSFSYATGNDKLSTQDFSQNLEKYISAEISSQLNKNDRISFVTHSQGGLIALYWIINNKQHKVGFKSISAVKKIENFITLGTPFWGSKIATLVSKKIPGFITNTLVDDIGRQQMRDLSLLSPVNMQFRELIHSHGSEILSGIRMLNVAGMATSNKVVDKKGEPDFLKIVEAEDKNRMLETDTMVSVSSARLDGFYTEDLRKNYDENTLSPTNIDYNMSYQIPFLVVKAYHASPLPKTDFDLSYVSSACSDFAACKHPSYKYIVDFFQHKQIPHFAEDIPWWRMANSPLYFKFILDSAKPNVNVKIERITNEEIPNVQLWINPPSEMYATYKKIDTDHPEVQYQFLSTCLRYSEFQSDDFARARWEGMKAKFRISAEGYKSKIIEIVVKPTFASYNVVSLSLKK